jgi:2-polyprenyl-3-methyl-5-hydroxy-6-metoxy-1,4-benzoquinol methylase
MACPLDQPSVIDLEPLYNNRSQQQQTTLREHSNTDEFWQGRAQHWRTIAASPNSFYARRCIYVEELLRRHMGGRRVLDVGCGIGMLCRNLARQGFDAYGTDIAADMVAAAQETCADILEDPADKLRLCTQCELPFEGMQFDAITVIGVLPYVADQKALIRRLAPLLAATGVLVLSSTNAFSLFALREMVLHVGRLRPSLTWLQVFVNLARTGIWSGGARLDSVERIRTAGAFDGMLRTLGFYSIGSCDLFNFSLGSCSMDNNALRRSPLGAIAARYLAWTHIGVYSAARHPKT